MNCLTSPHHFTYLGVCYQGSTLTLGISSPQNPQAVSMHVTGVPEPGSGGLMALGLLVAYLTKRRG
jgi:hypothetical protein